MNLHAVVDVVVEQIAQIIFRFLGIMPLLRDVPVQHPKHGRMGLVRGQVIDDFRWRLNLVFGEE